MITNESQKKYLDYEGLKIYHTKISAEIPQFAVEEENLIIHKDKEKEQNVNGEQND